MLFLTRRKRMTGGLYFGPPAWHPTEIQQDRPTPAPAPADLPAPPADRHELLPFLRKIQLHNTSNIIPGVVDQLEHAENRHVRELILNLLPTQPEFALPSALSHIALPEIIAGLALLQKILRPRRTYIVLDRHDLRLRRIWRHTRQNDQSKFPLPKKPFDLKPLINQYPQAHPTLLVRRLFGRRLPVGSLPTRQNRLILDPVACWAIGRYLRTGEPLNQRPVQLFIRRGKSSSAQLVMAKLGETLHALCRRNGIALDTEKMQVIANGMLAGTLVDPLRTLVDSATESISLRENPLAEIPSPCFACGWCVDVCPTALNPVTLFELAKLAQTGDGGGAGIGPELRTSRAKESLHCISCGLCSYVCPTRLPLTQQITRLRNFVQS